MENCKCLGLSQCTQELLLDQIFHRCQCQKRVGKPCTLGMSGVQADIRNQMQLPDQRKTPCPKVMTHLCLHFAAFAFPLDSCLSVSAKSSSAHTFKLQVPSRLVVGLLSTVPAWQQMMHSTALLHDPSLGDAAHCAA